MLDYDHRTRPSTGRADRLVMGVLAVVNGMIGLAVLVVTVGLWLKTWPSFGMTLVVCPAGLVALAFGSVARAAAKVALGEQS